jgi:hypothetical protein
MKGREAYSSALHGRDWIVTINKSIRLKHFGDYKDLKELGSRWTSTSTQNNYLRFNSELSSEEIKEKLSEIFKVSSEDINVLPAPFLGAVPIF